MKNDIAKSAKQVFFFFALLSAIFTFSMPTYADSVVSVTRHDSSFDDIRIEIENAILEKGFVIDFNGSISRMLENTANVADDATPVFRHAEFWQFCSSRITRALTAANPINLAFCPFVVFAFETIEMPDSVTIGYRPLPADSSPKTNKLVSEINMLLESIVVKAGQ